MIYADGGVGEVPEKTEQEEQEELGDDSGSEDDDAEEMDAAGLDMQDQLQKDELMDQEGEQGEQGGQEDQLHGSHHHEQGLPSSALQNEPQEQVQLLDQSQQDPALQDDNHNHSCEQVQPSAEWTALAMKVGEPVIMLKPCEALMNGGDPTCTSVPEVPNRQNPAHFSIDETPQQLFQDCISKCKAMLQEYARYLILSRESPFHLECVSCPPSKCHQIKLIFVDF